MAKIWVTIRNVRLRMRPNVLGWHSIIVQILWRVLLRRHAVRRIRERSILLRSRIWRVGFGGADRAIGGIGWYRRAVLILWGVVLLRHCIWMVDIQRDL